MMKYLLFILLVILSLNGCSAIFSSRIIVEKDEVKNTTRIRKEFYYEKILEHRSKLNFVKQTVLKEIDEDTVKYSFFDVLNFDEDAFDLDNEVYLIVDNNVYPVKIKGKETVLQNRIREDEDDISTSDSTSVSVITDITNYQQRIVRINYSVSPEIMDQVLNCKELRIRYYSGSDMLTIRMKGCKLKKLKKLIRYPQ